MRTSVFCTFDEPTLIYSPLSSTRNKRAWVDKGNSPTSSKKIVPPSASAKYPLRSLIAPVKAPFSWPKSSESMVPSGIAPQFTAIYCPCLRRLNWWIICGKFSFPTPLSPVINTDKSVGATWIAISIARFSPSEFPIMPNLSFTFCISDLTIFLLVNMTKLQIPRQTASNFGRKNKKQTRISRINTVFNKEKPYIRVNRVCLILIMKDTD